MTSLNYSVKELADNIAALESSVNTLNQQKTIKFITGVLDKNVTMESQAVNTVRFYLDDGSGSGSDWPTGAAGAVKQWMVTTVGDNDNPATARIYQQAIQVLITDTRTTNLLMTRVKQDATYTPWRPVGLQDIIVNMTDNTVNLTHGNYFIRTGISGAQTFSITGASEVQDNTCITIVVDITTTGATTATWWSNVRWDGGTAPAFTANGRGTFGFISKDKGATWDGYPLGKDMK